MSQAASIRLTVRNLITSLGKTASLYSFSTATKTTNDEGEYTVSSWGTATSIKAISSNHYSIRRLLKTQGEENDESDRVFIIRDDVTISVRDKLTVGTDVYLVNEVKKIDPIEDNITIAQRIVVVKDDLYV